MEVSLQADGSRVLRRVVVNRALTTTRNGIKKLVCLVSQICLSLTSCFQCIKSRDYHKQKNPNIARLAKNIIGKERTKFIPLGLGLYDRLA